MKTNVLLMAIGTSMALIGLYRSGPVKVNVSFLLNTGSMVIVLAILVIAAYQIGGVKFLWRGWAASLEAGRKFVPMLLLLLPAMGFGFLLAGYYQEGLQEHITGRFGMAWTLVAALCSPLTSSIAGFIQGLWQDPVMRPMVQYFLVTTPMVSWNTFAIRFMGLGWDISVNIYRLNLLIAVVLLPVFWLIARLRS